MRGMHPIDNVAILVFSFVLIINEIFLSIVCG